MLKVEVHDSGAKRSLSLFGNIFQEKLKKRFTVWWELLIRRYKAAFTLNAIHASGPSSFNGKSMFRRNLAAVCFGRRGLSSVQVSELGKEDALHQPISDPALVHIQWCHQRVESKTILRENLIIVLMIPFFSLLNTKIIKVPLTLSLFYFFPHRTNAGEQVWVSM